MTSILGKTADGPLTADQIELWDLPATAEIAYETSEFSALCPVTHQPDIYQVKISYTAPRTFESKGMKHYLWSFRDQGIGCEHLTILIAQELADRLSYPVTVSLTQQVRGGLVLSAAHTAAPYATTTTTTTQES